MSSTSTTPTAGDTPGPSIEAPPPSGRLPQVGETVLVKVDLEVVRPLLVTAVTRLQQPLPGAAPGDRVPVRTTVRVSGTIFCDPEDHTRPAFRGTLDTVADPAHISGRPDRLLPLGYGELLLEGRAVGQWQFRPGGAR